MNSPHPSGESRICENCAKPFPRLKRHIPYFWARQKFCSRPCGRPTRKVVTKDEFFSRTIPCPTTGCWFWEGLVDSKGYGIVWIDGKNSKASRVSWAFTKGKITPGLFVCHRCDTPSCVNPDHLFLGTQAENMADMKRKGRSADRRGEKSSVSKLKAPQVLSILQDSRATAEVAAQYGVSPSTISAIRSGQNWSWLRDT